MAADTGPCGYFHAAIPGLKRGGEDCAACMEMNQPRTELRECPFCGGVAAFRHPEGSSEWRVECQECHTSTPRTTRSLAETLWNKRAAGSRNAVPEADAPHAGPVKFPGPWLLNPVTVCRCGAAVPFGWEHVCEYQTTRPPSR